MVREVSPALSHRVDLGRKDVTLTELQIIFDEYNAESYKAPRKTRSSVARGIGSVPNPGAQYLLGNSNFGGCLGG